MASLKEIRNRITSISSTMQITSAMKMVSASKLKKAQDAITSMTPYSENLIKLTSSLLNSVEIENLERFVEKEKGGKVLMVIITSNKGLCGAFNSSVIRKVRNSLKEEYKDREMEFLTIGKKGHEILSKEISISDNQNDILENLNYDSSSVIADSITEKFLSGEYDKVEVVYNSFKNTSVQITLSDQFLPLKPSDNGDENINMDYIVEPDADEIVKVLLKKSLKINFYRILRDSIASEHGARMTAMHKATDNASELKSELVLTYNKARQTAITSEILEIVGGAEALNS